MTAQTLTRSARPEPAAALLSPACLARDLWARRDLIRQFTIRMFLARHRGTHLGVLWSLLLPLTLLGVYTFVFNSVFRSRAWGARETGSALEFAVILFCGMTTYSIFSETTTRAASLITENPNFVKRVVFPVEVLPVASLGSALLFGAIGYALVLIGGAAVMHTVHLTTLLLPVVLLPLLAISLGVAWFLSSLGVFLRDIGNLAGIVIGQVLFFLTPVLYDPERLGQFGWVARINPLTPIVEGARRVMLFGETPDWRGLALSALFGLAVLQLGYAWFMKSKRGFADVL